jgi:predicted AAA+ superfamily ATPase
LVRLIEPLEIRLKKKGGNDKICVADHGLRASWLQEQIPLAPDELAGKQDLSTLAGFLAESVVGATLSTVSGLDLAHLPARKNEPEVDFVMTVGTKRIPVEIKYQRSPDPVRDTAGLRAFMQQPANRAPFGLIITQTDTEVDYGAQVVSLPLSTFMLIR